jgi:hypothetical protein
MDGRVVIAILFAHRLFLASGFLRWLGGPGWVAGRGR